MMEDQTEVVFRSNESTYHGKLAKIICRWQGRTIARVELLVDVESEVRRVGESKKFLATIRYPIDILVDWVGQYFRKQKATLNVTIITERCSMKGIAGGVRLSFPGDLEGEYGHLDIPDRLLSEHEKCSVQALLRRLQAQSYG